MVPEPELDWSRLGDHVEDQLFCGHGGKQGGCIGAFGRLTFL